MQSIDLEVLETAEKWVAEGRPCELVTVIKTWGSSPRPEGSMLAIRDDGAVVGSVSGGCIEDDLIDRAARHGIARTAPEIVTYGITADQAHRFGLPCGGTIQLAIEPLSAHSRIDELVRRLHARETVARRVDLVTGEVRLRTARPSESLQVSSASLLTLHGPRWRLLLIGAGQMSRFLAEIATGMDYQVTVCDPREEYRHDWNVRGVTLRHDMPDDVVMEMQLDVRSAVVALTHDPKLDDLALMEALKSDAFYVGAIGSRVNSEKRRERLKMFDLSDAQVERLRGPTGLYIGSKTPAEIAISILAEITAVKNNVRLPASMQAGPSKTALGLEASGASCGLGPADLAA